MNLTYLFGPKAAKPAATPTPPHENPLRNGQPRDIAAEMIAQVLGAESGPTILGAAYRSVACLKPDCDCSGGTILTFDRSTLGRDAVAIDSLLLGVGFRDLTTSRPIPLSVHGLRMAAGWIEVFFGRKSARGYWKPIPAHDTQPDQYAGLLFVLPIDRSLHARHLKLPELIALAQGGFLSHRLLERDCRWGQTA